MKVTPNVPLARGLRVAVAVCLAFGAACSSPNSDGRSATPIYNKDTGKLEALQSDTNGDGKPDARAVMDGAVVRHVEIDRDHDGKPDRWEYYAPPERPDAPGRPVLVRAEEANGTDGKVTRREFHERGVIARVEEDTDFDGKLDKWEQYTAGALTRMDLDLTGRGTPDRRMIYGPGGKVERVESDPDGDGIFTPLPNGPDTTSTRK